MHLPSDIDHIYSFAIFFTFKYLKCQWRMLDVETFHVVFEGDFHVNLLHCVQGQFVSEYVGDLISANESRRRLHEAQRHNRHDFYMMTLDDNRWEDSIEQILSKLYSLIVLLTVICILCIFLIFLCMWWTCHRLQNMLNMVYMQVNCFRILILIDLMCLFPLNSSFHAEFPNRNEFTLRTMNNMHDN